MTIEEIESVVELWNAALTNRQKRYMHIKSLTNFVFHFSSLPNPKIQEKALKYIDDYVIDVQDNTPPLTTSESYALLTKYITPLSEIYRSYLGFKSILPLKFIVVFAIAGDLIVYLVTVNRVSFFILVFTPILLTYYISRKLWFEKKRKLYGPFY